VRAAAGLDAGNAVRRQRARAHQELRIPFGVDVVGDRGDVVALPHRLAEQVHQRGLAGADGTADADAEGTVRVRHIEHSLVYRRPCERRDPYAAASRWISVADDLRKTGTCGYGSLRSQGRRMVSISPPS
jgi:hypothetical protein